MPRRWPMPSEKPSPRCRADRRQTDGLQDLVDAARAGCRCSAPGTAGGCGRCGRRAWPWRRAARRYARSGSRELRRSASRRCVTRRRRGVETEDHPHRGGLAGAVGAEEAGDHARPDVEGQVVDGQLLAVTLGQAPELDHRRPPSPSPTSLTCHGAHATPRACAAAVCGLRANGEPGPGSPGGHDLGADSGADLGADLGANSGADLGADLGADEVDHGRPVGPAEGVDAAPRPRPLGGRRRVGRPGDQRGPSRPSRPSGHDQARRARRRGGRAGPSARSRRGRRWWRSGRARCGRRPGRRSADRARQARRNVSCTTSSACSPERSIRAQWRWTSARWRSTSAAKAVWSPAMAASTTGSCAGPRRARVHARLGPGRHRLGPGGVGNWVGTGQATTVAPARVTRERPSAAWASEHRTHHHGSPVAGNMAGMPYDDEPGRR